MRKIFIVLALAAAVAGGCNKWLDVEPVDKILEKTAYSSESGINSVLNGLYYSLMENDLYGDKIGTGVLDVLAHYYDFPTASMITGKDNLEDLYNLGMYQYDDIKEKYFGPMWKKGYKLILGINVFIDNVESSSVLSEDNKRLYLGEAYGLRAMMHMELYRLFGPATTEGATGVLPYHREGTVQATAYLVPTAFLTEVQKDLEKAGKYLDKDPILDGKVYDGSGDDTNLSSAQRFARMFRNKRMNYWAVRVLEMRLAMLQGRQDDVLVIGADIMTNAVDDAATLSSATLPLTKSKPFAWNPAASYAATNWIGNAILYDEVIFGPTKADQESWWKENFLSSSASDNDRVITENNLKTNVMGSEEELNKAMENDKRFASYNMAPLSAGAIGDAAQGNYYVSRKYSDDIYSDSESLAKGSLAYNSRNMRALMRLSEVQLMMAEVYANMGLKDQAATLLNVMMERAGFQVSTSGTFSTTKLIPASATLANVKRMLELEYYREFQMEGQVFHYLKRNGSASVIGGNALAPVTVNTSAWVLPRPQSEVDYDSN